MGKTTRRTKVTKAQKAKQRKVKCYAADIFGRQSRSASARADKPGTRKRKAR